MDTKININKDGEITITRKVLLTVNKAKKLIKRVTTDDSYYTGEEGHKRWTILYNAYDMFYDTDIRKEHSEEGRLNETRLDYMLRAGKLNELLYVVSKLYKNEFEYYVGDYMSE